VGGRPTTVTAEIGGTLTTNEQVVRDFCSAWLRRDLDEILSYISDDMAYHNIPVPPIEGRENVALIFKTFLEMMQHIDLEIVSLMVDGDKVFTERIDRMTSGDHHVDLPVGGYFVLRDNKIAVMHEYFDLSTFENQIGFKLTA
jgi:limonene-1,2-epoxide hydrolase